MSNEHYITSETLPISMNFDLLKAEALAFIQARSGSNWTNLNPSDPGITILDQVCYALTELGYCTTFPMRDLLTGENGELKTKNRFYLPSEILTTTPITTTDYRKVVIDSSEYIENAIVEFEYGHQPFLSMRIQVYYKLTATAPRANYDHQIHAALQGYRNLANQFSRPQQLKVKQILLTGQIVVENQHDIQQVLEDLEQDCDQTIFPKVGFQSLKSAMEETGDVDAVFNGPLLKRGFILDTDLVEKQDVFTTTKMAQLISGVENVIGVTSLKFQEENNLKTKVTCNTDELLVFDWRNSVNAGLLTFMANEQEVALSKIQPVPVKKHKTKEPPVNKVEANALVPKGNFRDVNTYYSIQNTFPASFGVGNQGVANKVLKPEVKQLKGYLTLIDQVMANQFSQLANIGELFSFENSWSGDPSDLKAYYASKNRLESLRTQSEYPAPYISFSPTYYYQSLYNIPNIKPLLKDNHVFDFSPELVGEAELEQEGWKAYKNDPYNAYMKGLMDLMVDKTVDLERRNRILDHLLARHGESALVIDKIINGSQYSGDPEQDRIIFKSLYLQNLALLSYYQSKGYDFAGAEKIGETPDEIVLQPNILQGQSFTNDFIFSSEKASQSEHLREKDFTNYAAVELKTSLLLGLKPLLADFIEQNYLTNPEGVRQALWLLNKRKGLLLIETCLLQKRFDYEQSRTGGENVFSLQPQLIFILPDYVDPLNTLVFQNRMDYLLRTSLPVEVSYTVCLLSQGELEVLIPLFVAWHDSMIQSKSLMKNVTKTTVATELKTELEKLLTKDD